MQELSRLITLACAIGITSVSLAQTISITATAQALSFGSFSPGGGSGTVTVTPAGARIPGGGVILVPYSSGQAALFTVSGDPNLTYSITLPGNLDVSLTSFSNSMVVNSFASSPAGAGQLSGGGSQNLLVGATLSVGGNQASGSYTGTYNVIVNFP
jgi:hypothetical protein